MRNRVAADDLFFDPKSTGGQVSLAAPGHAWASWDPAPDCVAAGFKRRYYIEGVDVSNPLDGTPDVFRATVKVCWNDSVTCP